MTAMVHLRRSAVALAFALSLAAAPAMADGTSPGLTDEALAGWQSAIAGLRDMTPKWGIQPVDAFKTTLDAGVPMVMLDVRMPPEWAEGIIEGAVLVSLPDLPTAEGLAKLPADLSAAIGVYCKSGHRSALALSLLHQLGYTNAINMAGGFEAWKKAEFPFVMPQQ